MKYTRVLVQGGPTGDYEVSGIDTERVISEAGTLAAKLSLNFPGAGVTMRVVFHTDLDADLPSRRR